MTTPWKTIKTNILHKSKWNKIIKDDVITHGGTKGEYTYIKRENGVAVMPIINNQIYLTSQYRYPIQKTIIQIPLEIMKKSEQPESAVHRCLSEELGLKAKNIVQLGQAYADAGLDTQKLFFYIAQDLTNTKQQLENTEADLKVIKRNISELDQMVKNHEIIDFHSIVGVYYLQKYFKN